MGDVIQRGRAYRQTGGHLNVVDLIFYNAASLIMPHTFDVLMIQNFQTDRYVHTVQPRSDCSWRDQTAPGGAV